MSLVRNNPQDGYTIKGYKPGTLYLEKQNLNTNSVIITATKLIPNWATNSIDKLCSQDLNIIYTLNTNILLIGTGTKFIRIQPAIYSALIIKNIGVEIMNTHAACRTYNALISENRPVAAALFL